MKAGRELDALIAEKVMGWKVNRDEWYVSKPHKDKENAYWYVPLTAGEWGAFCPSTQIADAWLVIDAKEWELQMVVHKRGKHKGQTGAILSFDLFMEEREGILGDTPAHAICLAALEAVEGSDVK